LRAPSSTFALSGWPLRSSPLQHARPIARPGTSPPLALHSPSEYDAGRYSVLCCSKQQYRPPPSRSAPLQRFHRSTQQLNPRFSTAWVTWHSQVFPTSQCFTPRATFRPCFMPIPLLGFALQGFSLRNSRVSSRNLLPLCRLLMLRSAMPFASTQLVISSTRPIHPTHCTPLLHHAAAIRHYAFA
jgi:hypothetical protein